jgi:uncharacterized membrane protein (UPF0127 family)
MSGRVAVRNPGRAIELTPGAIVADSAFARMRGLLGRDDPGDGAWIEPCSQVHTMFMRAPIDVIFVDRDDRVLHVTPALRPWRLSRWVRGARAVLELAAGHAGSTAAGDQLERSPCASSS